MAYNQHGIWDWELSHPDEIRSALKRPVQRKSSESPNRRKRKEVQILEAHIEADAEQYRRLNEGMIILPFAESPGPPAIAPGSAKRARPKQKTIKGGAKSPRRKSPRRKSLRRKSIRR